MSKKKLIALCIGMVGLVFLFLVIGACIPANADAAQLAMFILGLLFSVATIICLIICLIGKQTTVTTTPTNE